MQDGYGCELCHGADTSVDRPLTPGYQVMIWDCPTCGLPIDVVVSTGTHQAEISLDLRNKDGS